MGFGSCRTRTEDVGGRGMFQGGCRGREGAETTRQRKRGFRGGRVGRGGAGRGENCELASDVALPFLGFTSFIRRAVGSSRAVELQFLLFLLWNTQRIQTRSCRDVVGHLDTENCPRLANNNNSFLSSFYGEILSFCSPKSTKTLANETLSPATCIFNIEHHCSEKTACL